MLSTPAPWDDVASDYERELVPAFESFARDALDAAALSPGACVLDVAAGPGTLACLAAQAGMRVTAVDFAPRMIERLRARAPTVVARVADGQALPFEAESFDAAFSLFGLMFFPDRACGLRELRRVLRPGGRAFVSSWTPFDCASPEMLAIYGTFAELAGGSKSAPPQPLSDPAVCDSEMRGAGFADVVVRELETAIAYPSTAAMIDATLRSSAPAVLARRGMGEARWEALVATLHARVTTQLGAGPQKLVLSAYLSAGTS